MRWLPLSVVSAALPALRARGVSAVARGDQRSDQTRMGFVAAYAAVEGRPHVLAQRLATGQQTWAERRDAFLRRHLAQAKANGETWWKDGRPTRRHLALVAWAYSPTPQRLKRWLAQQELE